MRFTTVQLETLADLLAAKMPLPTIAERLGVDLVTFKAWATRLAKHRDWVEPVPTVSEILRDLAVTRQRTARIAAERMFEDDASSGAGDGDPAC
jgi:hypothetical protein